MFRTAITRALLVAAFVVAIVSGTAAQEARPTPEGTRWHLVASDAGALEGPAWPWDLDATLTLSEGRAFGSAGCNGFGADYEFDGEALSFGPPRLSNADCADATMGIEAAYMAALPKAVRWGFDTGPAGDRLLLLFDVDDELLLAFTEADIATPTPFPDPEGGPWLDRGPSAVIEDDAAGGLDAAGGTGPAPTLDPLGDFTHVSGDGAMQGLDWQPAAGPALEEGASLVRPTAWAGGFAVVERPRTGDNQTPHAVRTSADGRSWERTGNGGERAGKPMIEMTDEAALIAIPMRTTGARGSGAACLGPTKLTIRLPEPLGQRTLYDAGSLPLRGANEKLDIDHVNASGSGG
jgi:heat shock protein HslJ